MNKQIFRLAIPNILSNLSVPLLSSVDTAVVGHLDKVSYLGAIAIGSMIFNFVYWAFGFKQQLVTWDDVSKPMRKKGTLNVEEIHSIDPSEIATYFAEA